MITELILHNSRLMKLEIFGGLFFFNMNLMFVVDLKLVFLPPFELGKGRIVSRLKAILSLCARMEFDLRILINSLMNKLFLLMNNEVLCKRG